MNIVSRDFGCNHEHLYCCPVDIIVPVSHESSATSGQISVDPLVQLFLVIQHSLLSDFEFRW